MPKTWRLAPLAIALLPGAALAAAALPPAPPQNVTVNMDSGPVNPDGTGLKSDTSIDLHMADADAKFTGSFTSDPSDPVQPMGHAGSTLGFDTTMHGPSGVDFSIAAQSDSNTDRQQGVLMPPGLARTSATTEETGVTATATDRPFSDAGVTAGISQSHAVTAQSNVPAGGAVQSTDVTVDDRQVFANLQWTPLSMLSIEAGGKAESVQATTHNTAPRVRKYRYTEPKIAATAKPWDGSTLKISSKDTVSPLNATDFAALAQAAGPGGDLRLAPNREWQNQAQFTQTFGNGASLSASVTQARIESTTELALTGLGAVAPVSVFGGIRREAEANFSLPLADLGLPDTSISAQASWRRSQIRDPLTGEMRRVSGEVPRAAGVRISHKDKAHHLEWGVTGALATRQTFYQPAEVTAQKTASGAGAFIEYKPGNNYTVSLNADGLIGGARSQTDLSYIGSRTGNLETVTRTRDSDPLLSFSISRALN